MTPIPADRCDAGEIKAMLAYVHHWEARERGGERMDRVEAARRAIRNLSPIEADILLRALHVDASEVRS
jgi:hypothetical protein